MAERPKEVAPGDPITAEGYNQLIRWVAQQNNLTVAFPLDMSSGSHGNHIAMKGPYEPFAIELQEALTSGSSADAYRLKWTGSDWTTTGADTIEVHDTVAGSRAGESGDRGWAFFCRLNGRFELIVLGC